jgi:hypothetical protein
MKAKGYIEYAVSTNQERTYIGLKEDIIHQMFSIKRDDNRKFYYRAKFGKFNDDGDCLEYGDSWTEKELYKELVADLFKKLPSYGCKVFNREVYYPIKSLF